MTRLASISRFREAPKPDCAVCSDDSGSIATVTLANFDEIKFADLIDKILPDCLGVKKDGELLVDQDGKILFERFEDMSEDEAGVYTNRLAKSLSQLGLKPFSIVMLTADTQDGLGRTIHVQLLQDAALAEPWKAVFLKKGVAKKPSEKGASPEDEETKSVAGQPTEATEMAKSAFVEIEDDEVLPSTAD